MLIQDSLQGIIDDWLSTALIRDSKSVEIHDSPIKQDEFMIVFTIDANIEINHIVSRVVARKRFFTIAQNDAKLDPEGDVNRLKDVLVALDVLFMGEIDAQVSG